MINTGIFAVISRHIQRTEQISELQKWLDGHKIESVETIVPDIAGMARGKLQPVELLTGKPGKLPIAVLAQSCNGLFHLPTDNVGDQDMLLRPDVASLRVVPWASEPTASAIMDCFYADGEPVGHAPRAVLQRVIGRYQEHGWTPVVAPEVEFYLTRDPESELEAPLGELTDPYGLDGIHDLDAFFEQLYDYCRAQDIQIGAASQELGPAQFEINFQHGDAVKLADDVFHFKRTLKRVALDHGMRVTFLAKVTQDGPGSSLHIHQSVVGDDGNNVFSTGDGEPSELFHFYLGGLQQHMRDALLLFAPYANSYRRFLSYYSSPVNLEWGVDNRTVGLRVPDSEPAARRIENRLAGSDVNPYLAIAGTLACGLAGMTSRLPPRAAVAASAYDLPFALHRDLYEALDAFAGSSRMREILGDEFVTTYSKVKELEHREFQARIPDWERDELMFTV